MNILQISTADRGGGAEGSALNLHKAYRAAGEGSWMAVGTKYSDDPDIVEIPREPAPGLFNSLMFKLATASRKNEYRFHGMRRLSRIFERLSNPERFSEWKSGLEEFEFPGCKKLLAALPITPDVIHCHNLHGYYFDLRLLPELSRRFPVILNLRDTWHLTGHCAYFMDCMKWRDACGNCPRLGVYPAVRKNSTAANWLRKQDIYARSRLYVTAPSKWLIEQAQASMLHAVEYRVIPNGIDTDVFCPGEQVRAREELGLPQNVKILMFATAAAKTVFKDTGTLVRTAEILAEKMPPLHFLCVGTRLRQLEALPNFHPMPFVSSPEKMAQCYRASDVFIHTAKAEAFGKTVTEAMACGTPVVASSVGGITEQILDGENGFLAEMANPADMAGKVLELLSSDNMAAFKEAAANRGRMFSLNIQVRNFLNWYEEIVHP